MHRMNFSKIELWDLLKSFAALGIAFAIASYGFSNMIVFSLVLVISLLTAGVAFLLHELAHKFVAQKFGCWSEFRADDKMLILMLIVSFMGFIFAAPGAVMIHGHITKKQYGLISAAGPITNFVLAGIFYILGTVVTGGILGTLFAVGFQINTWIGLFNMIPFHPFDGSKILAWNKVVFGVLVAIGIILMIL